MNESGVMACIQFVVVLVSGFAFGAVIMALLLRYTIEQLRKTDAEQTKMTTG